MRFLNLYYNYVTNKKDLTHMNKDFFKALEALGEENSVETELLIDKVKSAMLKAARRAYPHSEERISVEIDPKTKKFEMYIRQDIIDDEPIDVNEVNIDVAKTMDPNAVVGGTILKELDISKLGRMAALSAKQSIKGDLREINREQMLSRFGKSVEDNLIDAFILASSSGRERIRGIPP